MRDGREILCQDESWDEQHSDESDERKAQAANN
jgi:hypothetical protein